MNPNINIFTIFAPKTFPTARDGFGGFKVTAEIFADNSGKEVANATKILPTNNLPSPVIEAIISPYLAR